MYGKKPGLANAGKLLGALGITKAGASSMAQGYGQMLVGAAKTGLNRKVAGYANKLAGAPSSIPSPTPLAVALPSVAKPPCNCRV